MSEERAEYKSRWTVPELAAKAGLTPHRIRQLIAANEIKATKEGRDWFILDSEAKRWLATRAT
jgi:hypothetical protein